MGTPVLVDSEWLEAVDAFVRSRMEAPLPAPTDGGSRFYDVRPAKIVGEWKTTTIDSIKHWSATAYFIINDVVDKSFEIDVYAPLSAGSDKAPSLGDASVFVVWRGRWELLAGASGSLTVTKINAVTGFTPMKFTYAKALTAASAVTTNVVTSVELELSQSATSRGIVTNVGCEAGKLTFEICAAKIVATKEEKGFIDPQKTTDVVTDATLQYKTKSVVQSVELN